MSSETEARGGSVAERGAGRARLFALQAQHIRQKSCARRALPDPVVMEREIEAVKHRALRSFRARERDGSG